MARKAETKKDDSLNIALGKPIEIDCFLDGKVRKAFPITLADYGEFAKLAPYVSFEGMLQTFLSDDGESLKKIIEMVYLEEDVDTLMSMIDSSNYPEFIRLTFETQGIKLDNDSGKEKKR